VPLLGALAVPLSLLSSCTIGGPGDRSEVLNGNAVTIGHGSAWAYLTLRDGVPLAIGVTLSDRALTGLPGVVGPGERAAEAAAAYEYVLQLPALNPTPYRHIVVRWNPRGHEPAGLYDVPHFDFYFFTISDQERQLIDPRDPRFDRKAARRPTGEYVPEGYVVSSMPPLARTGMPWIGAGTSEVGGQRFTTDFAYGSWDGRMVFAEPMATLAFLKSGADTAAPLAVARAYDPSGYYPSAYSVRYDARRGRHLIALSDFAIR
jgi:hypothetical protein